MTDLKTHPNCEKHPRYSTHPFCPDCQYEVEAERKEQDSNLKTWPEHAYICQTDAGQIYDESKGHLLFFGKHSAVKDVVVEYIREDVSQARVEAEVSRALSMLRARQGKSSLREMILEAAVKAALEAAACVYEKHLAEVKIDARESAISNDIRNLNVQDILKGMK